MILSLIEAVDFIRTVEGSTGIHDGDIRVRIPTPAVDDQHDPRGMSECGAFIRAHPEIGSPYGAHLVGIQTGWLRDHGFLLVKRIESLLNMLDSYIVSTDRGLKGH